MYQFGQFLGTNQIDYQTIVEKSDLRFSYFSTSASNDILNGNQVNFANYSMRYNSGNTIFENLHYYYLNFKIKKRKNDKNDNSYQQVFYLKLQRVESESVKKEQYIKTFRVPNSPLQDDQNNYVSFEVIIAPNSNYNQLIWEMQREIIDYNITETIENQTYNGRIAIIQVDTFSEIINQINGFQLSSENSSLSKIGVQGPPSLLMCINGEQIRIGKNGIYEISNSIQITFLGFIPKSSSDFFIVDYEYGGED